MGGGGDSERSFDSESVFQKACVYVCVAGTVVSGLPIPGPLAHLVLEEC